MIKIDENQEAIAHIKMVIDPHDLATARILEEENENDGGAPPESLIAGSHWKLGSPMKMVTAQEWGCQ